MRSPQVREHRLFDHLIIFLQKESNDVMSSDRQNGCSVSEPVPMSDVSADPVGRLLKISDVCFEIGLSRAMIYRLINNEQNPFPKPIKIGNASRWSLIEIIEWKIKALAERD